jgi:hypothetical protein
VVTTHPHDCMKFTATSLNDVAVLREHPHFDSLNLGRHPGIGPLKAGFSRGVSVPWRSYPILTLPFQVALILIQSIHHVGNRKPPKLQAESSSSRSAAFSRPTSHNPLALLANPILIRIVALHHNEIAL